MIDQWDIAAGTLTFHPLTGPGFAEGKTVIRLMDTRNTVNECLFGSYEMMTLPNPDNHDNKDWIGNLVVSNSNYEFTYSNSNLDHHGDQKSNFFRNHPNGTVTVNFAENVNLESQLEDFQDNSVVVTIKFTSTDGTASSAFDILVSTPNMRLALNSDDIPFEMDKGWSNYWD